jgi:hypothetical protein
LYGKPCTAESESPRVPSRLTAKADKVPLSRIIKVLNECFGTDLVQEDRLFFAQIKERAVQNHQVIPVGLKRVHYPAMASGGGA